MFLLRHPAKLLCYFITGPTALVVSYPELHCLQWRFPVFLAQSSVLRRQVFVVGIQQMLLHDVCSSLEPLSIRSHDQSALQSTTKVPLHPVFPQFQRTSTLWKHPRLFLHQIRPSLFPGICCWVILHHCCIFISQYCEHYCPSNSEIIHTLSWYFTKLPLKPQRRWYSGIK